MAARTNSQPGARNQRTNFSIFLAKQFFSSDYLLMPLPSRPTPEVINSRLQTWERLENYRLQEQSLALLFSQAMPAKFYS